MADPPRKELPPRRPRISRAYLEEHRRGRYVRATAELLHEFGREGASVTNIVRLGGTARNSFYDVFTSAEDCIAYGIGVAVEELFATLESQDGTGEWSAEVDQAISGFYVAVAGDPILSELLLIHAAGSRVEHGRSAARAGAERFVSLFGRGRAAGPAIGPGHGRGVLLAGGRLAGGPPGQGRRGGGIAGGEPQRGGAGGGVLSRIRGCR